MSEPQTWVSVEKDELVVDHGGGRESVVDVCSCGCHIPVHASASSETRADMYSDARSLG